MLAIGLMGLNAVSALVDLPGKLRSFARSHAHLERYDDAQKHLAKEARGTFGTPLTPEHKKSITDPFNKSVEQLQKYTQERNNLFDTEIAKAGLDVDSINKLKALGDTVTKQWTDAMAEIEDRNTVFGKAVDNVGVLQGKKLYHVEDLQAQPYLLRDQMKQALEKQHDLVVTAVTDIVNDNNFAPGKSPAEKEALKDQLIEQLKNFNEKQISAVGKDAVDTMNAVHNSSRLQFNEMLLIEHNRKLFEALAIFKLAQNQNNSLLTIRCDGQGTELEMRGINLQTLVEDLAAMNAERVKNGEKPLTLESSAGREINLKRDGESYIISSYIPMKLNILFHWNPRQSLEDLVHSQIEMAMGMGMVDNGKAIVLVATHKDPKEAEIIAIKQYLAAINLGLEPGKDFFCSINDGPEKSAGDMAELAAKRGFSTELTEMKKKAGRDKAPREKAINKVTQQTTPEELVKFQQITSQTARDFMQHAKNELNVQRVGQLPPGTLPPRSTPVY